MIGIPEKPPGYEQASQVLARLGQSLSAAAGHGALCGMLCAGGNPAGRSWFAEMLAGGDDAAASAMLEALLADTMAQLTAPDMAFQPMLPDDVQDLGVRTRALGEWVQAYLYGLGAAGLGREGLSADVREALQDLEQISRVDFDLDHADESDELAYAEVLEHVRVSTMLIRDEVGVLEERTE